jgi:hypothetical protein
VLSQNNGFYKAIAAMAQPIKTQSRLVVGHYLRGNNSSSSSLARHGGGKEDDSRSGDAAGLSLRGATSSSSTTQMAFTLLQSNVVRAAILQPPVWKPCIESIAGAQSLHAMK